MHVSSILHAPVARGAFLAAMALGAAAIAWTSLAYLDEGDLHPFLLDKGDVASSRLFLAALAIHVVSAVVALPLCLALMLRVVVRRAPGVHRWLGRAVAVVVLAALVPSGFVLAPHAKAGVPSTVGFALSGLIVVVMMVRAVRSARARDFIAHRHAIAHVVGQMSVAVTSRALLMLSTLLPVSPDAAYVVALWVPLVVHVVVVEMMFADRGRSAPSLSFAAGGRDDSLVAVTVPVPVAVAVAVPVLSSAVRGVVRVGGPRR